MTLAYEISLAVLQMIIGVGTGITILHFAAISAVRAVKGDLRRRTPERPLRYVFMVPCLNEELVIAQTIKRLLAVPGDVNVLVIDDGSSDGTAAIVRAAAEQDPRVGLLQRVAPNARQGKGRALNAGYLRISRDCAEQGLDPHTVVVCVMDADGLLDSHAVREVDGIFGDDAVGAVQIGVRILNRERFRGRLQDIEFFAYASVIQKGRNHVGSVGLGGNGQFTRLSALQTLGETPWTDCLTEDLDLGLQLLIKRWKLAFTDGAYVHQQGLVDVRRLVRQRTRWAQGYFQSWSRIPEILRMRAKWYAQIDLLYCLMWPAVSCLILPIAILLSWFVVAYNLISLTLPFWSWASAMAAGYIFAFGITAMLCFHYRARSRDLSIGRTIVLIHLIGLYQYMWAIAGWWSIYRIITGHGSWAKTERLALPPQQEQAERTPPPTPSPLR